MKAARPTRLAAPSRTVLLALGAALLSAVASAQAAKQPITHETLILMKRVGVPVPSPDGRWVVFSLTEPAYDEKDQVSDLWIVPSDGGAKPRRLTSTKGAESGAAFGPDSRRLAFSARREGDDAAQIYVLDLQGGEAQRVTSLSTGARLPRWRPDGSAILFTSTVYPGAADDEANKKIAAERKAQKFRVRAYDGFPIRYWDKWLDDLQPHVFVQALEPGAKAKDLLAGTKLVAQPGFAGRETDTGSDLDAVWAPDGSAVVFAATTERDRAAWAELSTALWSVPAAGGEPRQVTTARGSYTNPTFSPDGRALYAQFRPEAPKVYVLNRIARLPWPGGGPATIVTATTDRAPSGFELAPDGKTIYFTAEDAGLEKLYSVPAEGGEVTLALDPGEGVYGGLAIPEKAAPPLLFANWASSVRPAEVVRLDLAAKKHVTLTDLAGEKAAQIDWQPPRHFWFTGKAGKKIHNMLVVPAGFDETKKYPLLVLMHGGPASMWRDQITLRWNYHLLARPGYVVLLTDYTGSTGYGEAFAQAIQGDPFRTPGNEINEAADEAIHRFAFIDGSRQCAAGASYGGHLANWMQATTTRYKCLVSHAGLMNAEAQWGTSDTIYGRELMNGGPPWEPTKTWKEQNPIRYAKAFKTPILYSVGENDFRVPLNNTLEAWAVTQRLRIPSRLLVWPEENHWILKAENGKKFYEEVHAWLAKYLGPAPAPRP
jgi:dipeptidyl aminopeptidase/acylaminoacyl peptidase